MGAGDNLGMGATHPLAAGMGGIRTAGDLVARMQMSRGMRPQEAKDYVADKLGCTQRDLSDPYAMEQIRGEQGLRTHRRPLQPAPRRAARDDGQVPHRRDAGDHDPQRREVQGAGRDLTAARPAVIETERRAGVRGRVRPPSPYSSIQGAPSDSATLIISSCERSPETVAV